MKKFTLNIQNKNIRNKNIMMNVEKINFKLQKEIDELQAIIISQKNTIILRDKEIVKLKEEKDEYFTKYMNAVPYLPIKEMLEGNTKKP